MKPALLVAIATTQARVDSTSTSNFTSVFKGFVAPMKADEFIVRRPYCASNWQNTSGALRDGKLNREAHDVYFEPTLVLPVSQKNPDTAYEANEWSKLTEGDLCSIFEFTLEKSKTKGKWCTLFFGMQNEAQMQRGDYYRYKKSSEGDFTNYTLKHFSGNQRPKEGVTIFNRLPGEAYPFTGNGLIQMPLG